MFKKYLNFRLSLSAQAGFTLVEAVAVIGVLAVTTAVLLVNNRVNEQQLTLNADIASIANVVGKAKALMLQGRGIDNGICGYGVSFSQGVNTEPDKYNIYGYKDCVSWDVSNRQLLSGQGGENALASGLRLLRLTAVGAQSQFIRDVIFYSSDARVKLFNFDGQSICESGCDVSSSAGIIVINTESAPTSFMTLKIATTGQVTSKVGAYGNSQNFDNGSEMILTLNGGGPLGGELFTYSGDSASKYGSSPNDVGLTFSEDTCQSNCFCALNLPSGGTCSDGCGGTCYAGSVNNNLPCTPLPTDCQAPSNTCGDYDTCGAPCSVCNPDINEFCINKTCQTCVCTPDVNGNTCGQCGGNCKGCSQPGESCTYQNNTWACTVVVQQGLRLDTIFPPVGYK